MIKSKYVLILSSLVITASLLGACGSKDEKPAATKDTGKTVADGAQTKNKPNQGKNAQPDLIGKVTAVSGNQVSLDLGEMPKPRAENQGDKASGEPQGEKPKADKPEGDKKTSQDGDKASHKSDAAKSPRQGVTFNAGKTTLTIPETVAITKGGGARKQKNADKADKGNNNPPDDKNNPPSAEAPTGPQQIHVSDIKVGDIITVWYSDKEARTISRINVGQAGQRAPAAPAAPDAPAAEK